MVVTIPTYPLTAATPAALVGLKDACSLLNNKSFLLFKGDGMTPAASYTCYDKYTDCAQHCDTHADECKKSCGLC